MSGHLIVANMPPVPTHADIDSRSLGLGNGIRNSPSGGGRINPPSLTVRIVTFDSTFPLRRDPDRKIVQLPSLAVFQEYKKFAHQRIAMSASITEIFLTHGFAEARLDVAYAKIVGKVAQNYWNKFWMLTEIRYRETA